MSKRNCESCGENVPKDRQFCGSCGAALPPVSPKKPVGKKIIGSVVGVIVGIAALVGAYIAFFPAPLGANDVRIDLNLPASEELWEGAQVDVSSKVTFYAKRDTDYTVVIETKNSSMTDWSEFTIQSGSFPSIELVKPAEILPGVNSFRVLVYVTDEPKPIVIGEEQAVFGKQAMIPGGCSEDSFNERMGLTGDPMTLFEEATSTSLTCSMAYPASDVFGIYAKFETKTDKEFSSMKKAAHGKAFKANVGETAAYRADYPNEGLGAWTDFVVNYHGIVVTTNNKNDLQFLIDMINVNGPPLDSN